MGTANSMACVAEAMGMSLPGSASIPATHAGRLRAAQASGRRVVALVRDGLTARRFISLKGLENAIRVTAAIGGSTNVALHLAAISHEAGVPVSLRRFDVLCRTTPHIAKLNPAAAANAVDFHRAGGVPAVMREILPLLHGDALTANGQTLALEMKAVPAGDSNIIRPFDHPWNREGGLAVLFGNLSPDGCITKPAAIHPDMHSFKGHARCFDSEEAATQAIIDGQIQPGDVVVVRYEGPKGGPGMPEMSTAMKVLYGRGLHLKTAIISDGRFSGTNSGCFAGHISPEAAEGGPIAIVRDGDDIAIDISGRSIRLGIDDAELRSRLAAWNRPPLKSFGGYLDIYARLATSAAEGARLKVD
jgi:dihydroxy-acid dehydratase